MTDVRVTSQPGTRVSVNVPQKEEARVSIVTAGPGESGGGGGGTTDYSPAFNRANLALGTAQSAFGLANTDFSLAQTAFSQANSNLVTAQSAFTKANTACTQADQAGTNANNAYGASNTVLITAQAAYAQANIDFSLAQTAFTKANTACTQSDAAGSQANAAYTKANNALANTTGTVNGSIIIDGHRLTNSPVLTLANIGAGTAGLLITSGVSGGFASLWGGDNWSHTYTNGQRVFFSNRGDGGTEGLFVFAGDDNSYSAAQATIRLSTGASHIKPYLITWDGFNNRRSELGANSEFFAYNWYADANTYERLALSANSNTINISSQALGANSIVRPINIQMNGVPTMTFTATGNVGIGRQDPGYKVDVVGTVNASAILVNGVPVITDYSPAFAQANLAYTQGNNAYNFANTVLLTAQGAFARANQGGGGGAGNAFLTVNTPANNITATSNVDTIKVRGGNDILITGNSGNNTLIITNDQTTEIAAFAKANTACTQSDTAGTQANVAYGKANTACTQSDFAGLQANSAWGRANTSTQLAFKTANTPANNLTAISNADTLIIRGGNDIQITGNTGNNTLIIQNDTTTEIAAFAKANTACTQSDTAGSQANIAYGKANTACTQSDAAGSQANIAYGKANTACTQSDVAGTQANSAWARANTSTQLAFKIANTPANNLTATSNQDTLIIRGGNYIQITGNTANNTLIIQDDITTQVAAFGKANTACTQSDFAGAQANSAWGRANTSTQLAFKTANTPANNLTATSNQDTLLVRGGNDIQITGNTANNTLIIQNDQTTEIAAFAKANTACTQSDFAGLQANSAWARGNTSTQLAFKTANTPANNLTAISNADTLIIRGGNFIQITGNTANNTLIIQDDITTQVAAFSKANTACTQSDVAGTQANSAWARANTSTQLAFKVANTPANNITASSNQDTILIRGGNDIQITGNTANQTIIIQNDTTTEIAAFAKANTACTQSDFAGLQANSAWARGNTSSQLAFKTMNTVANNITASSNQDTLFIVGGGSIIVTGNTANQTIMITDGTAPAAFTKANTACTQSDFAGLQANSAWARGNTSAQLAYSNIGANGTFIVAGSNASLITFVASNVSLVGNTQSSNVTFDLRDTGVTGGIYGGGGSVDSSNAVSVTVDSKGRVTAIANSLTIFLRSHTSDTNAINTAAQSQNWFPTSGNLTVANATTYMVEAELVLVDTLTTHTQSIQITGTATFDCFLINIEHRDQANNVIVTPQGFANGTMRWEGTDMATARVLNPTNIIGQHHTVLKGMIVVKQGGTICPRFQVSAVGAPIVGYNFIKLKQGTYFALYPVAANTANAIGPWSA